VHRLREEELQLLRYLAARPGQAVPREELLGHTGRSEEGDATLEAALARGLGFEGPLPGGAVAHAAEKGDLALVDALLAEGMAIDAPGKFGKTALRYAFGSGDLRAVAALLERGASREAAGGDAALLANAVLHGHYDLADWLLSQGVSVDATGQWERPAVATAADRAGAREGKRVERLAGIQFLVERGADLSIGGDHAALMEAIRDGERGVWRELLALGAPVEMPDASPLALAIKEKEMVIAAELIGRGAGLQDAVGRAALIKGEHVELLEALARQGARFDARDISAAMRARQPEMVGRLLAWGASAAGGRASPLSWALKRGHLELVDPLLAAGADPDVEGLLIEALPRGEAVLRALLEAGAAPTLDALRLAVEDAPELAPLLIEAGASADYRVLREALRRRRWSLIEPLLAHSEALGARNWRSLRRLARQKDAPPELRRSIRRARWRRR